MEDCGSITNFKPRFRVFSRWVNAISRTTGKPSGRQRLMQGLADGYFVIPYTIAPYLASIYGEAGSVTEDHPAFKETTKQVDALLRN